MNRREVFVGGPYFDELEPGTVLDSPPAVTLTSGQAATHQAVLGDRLRPALDASTAAAVLGKAAVLAHPGLIWDIAIGRSTLATHHVEANRFYRGLRFHHFPVLGDTLRTHTAARARPLAPQRRHRHRPARIGLALYRITGMNEPRPETVAEGTYPRSRETA